MWQLWVNVLVNSNKAEWITFLSIHVPFHLLLYYAFMAGCEIVSMCVFGCAGSAGDLFVVEHVYSGFQHLFIYASSNYGWTLAFLHQT